MFSLSTFHWFVVQYDLKQFWVLIIWTTQIKKNLVHNFLLYCFLLGHKKIPCNIKTLAPKILETRYLNIYWKCCAGYRYELYCASKNSKTTQVTVECLVSSEQAWQWNQARDESEQYTREAFDALNMRSVWTIIFLPSLCGLTVNSNLLLLMTAKGSGKTTWGRCTHKLTPHLIYYYKLPCCIII